MINTSKGSQEHSGTASFLQFLKKLFQIQLSPGDIIQFESGSNSKYYMLSATGTWDGIVKLQ